MEISFASNSGDITEELADIYEVLRCFGSQAGVSWDDVESRTANKRDQRGSFNERTVLMETSLPSAVRDEVSLGPIRLADLQGIVVEGHCLRIPFSRLMGETRPRSIALQMHDKKIVLSFSFQSDGLGLMIKDIKEQDEDSPDDQPELPLFD